MISYPLREYNSSKKDDDYFRLLNRHIHGDESSLQDVASSRSLFCRICCGCSILLILLFVFSSFSSSFTDPTCFKEQCLTSVCEAYDKGLVGGQLCPELCTSRTIQLENCLGQRRNARSRLFDLNEENELIRCYFRDRSNRSDTVGMNYSFPNEDLSLEEFSQSIEKHLKTLLPASDLPDIVDRLFTFVDFNRDGKISLSEGRSLWSLIQLDEFVYQFASAEKSYSPRIFRTCAQLFTVEKISHPHLPFNDQHQFDSTLDHPNWHQRVRISIGIVEFYLETVFPADAEADPLFLCSNIFRSFGYQNNYEAKMLKYDELVSRGASLSARCSLRCGEKDDQCLVNEYLHRTFIDLRRFLSEFVLPDGNETFVHSLTQLHSQMDETLRQRDLPARSNLLLQNLRNLLWTQIEFQLGKVTKKPTKTPSPAPLQSVK